MKVSSDYRSKGFQQERDRIGSRYEKIEIEKQGSGDLALSVDIGYNF